MVTRRWGYSFADVVSRGRHTDLIDMLHLSHTARTGDHDRQVRSDAQSDGPAARVLLYRRLRAQPSGDCEPIEQLAPGDRPTARTRALRHPAQEPKYAFVLFIRPNRRSWMGQSRATEPYLVSLLFRPRFIAQFLVDNRLTTHGAGAYTNSTSRST